MLHVLTCESGEKWNIGQCFCMCTCECLCTCVMCKAEIRHVFITPLFFLSQILLLNRLDLPDSDLTLPPRCWDYSAGNLNSACTASNWLTESYSQFLQSWNKTKALFISRDCTGSQGQPSCWLVLICVGDQRLSTFGDVAGCCQFSTHQLEFSEVGILHNSGMRRERPDPGIWKTTFQEPQRAQGRTANLFWRVWWA